MHHLDARNVWEKEKTPPYQDGAHKKDQNVSINIYPMSFMGDPQRRSLVKTASFTKTGSTISS